jgi:hypothetical protein
MEIAAYGIAHHFIEFCETVALRRDPAAAGIVPAGYVAAGFEAGRD